MFIKRVDPLAQEEWDDRIQAIPNYTLFHSGKWAKMINAAYGYQPVYFAILDDTGETVALFPFFLVKSLAGSRRLVSVPFTDKCSPLFLKDPPTSGIVELLEQKFRELRARYVEFRSAVPELFDLLVPLEQRRVYATHTVDLTKTETEIWHSLRAKSVRYPIKKAIRNSVRVDIGTTLPYLKIFVRLNVLTRRRHGIVPQPTNFFESLYQHVIATGSGFIAVAKVDGTPAAASVFLIDEQAAYHKFNASDPEFRSDGCNHLILWTTILHLLERGIGKLDLGRTSIHNPGLLSFKAGWGAEAEPLLYTYWPKVCGSSRVEQTGAIYRIAHEVVPIMPAPLLQFAGNLIYRHFG